MNARANAWLDASLARRLWFSETDDHDTGSMPFGLCRRGDLVVTGNVTCGAFERREIRMFDLEVMTQVDEPGLSPGSHRPLATLVARTVPEDRIAGHVVMERWECALVRAGAECRRLAVSPEGVLSMLADLAVMPDQDVELEAFNRAFEVRADDRAFASAFLDARMVSFLTERALGCLVEAVGNRILVARPADELPDDGEALMDLAFGVADRVPNAVTALYPPLPAGELTPRCPLGLDGAVRSIDDAIADGPGRAPDAWPDVPRGWA